MNNQNVTGCRGITFVLLAALLAGCSGQSQMTPANSSGSAQSISHATKAVAHQGRIEVAANLPGPTPHTTAAEFLATHRHAAALHPYFQSRGSKKLCSRSVYLFTNDNPTGNVDEFCEDAAPGATNKLIATCFGCGGWGLAVSPTTQQLAIGTSSSTVTTWTVAANGSVTPTGAVLTLSQAGYPYGICYDQSGGLYATNWPTNAIDHFTAAEVAGLGGTAAGTWFTQTTALNYFLACDYDSPKKGENYLMSSGFTPNSSGSYDFTVSEVVNGAPPVGNVNITDVISHDFGPYGFPGGLTLNRADNLVVADQYGYLNDMGTKEPWANPPVSTCTLGADYTGIAFDDTQREIWGADVSFSSPSTAGVSNGYSLPNGSPCTSPGESGGPAIGQNGESQYLGIAVWKNTGV